jgi:hypothetical protein
MTTTSKVTTNLSTLNKRARDSDSEYQGVAEAWNDGARGVNGEGLSFLGHNITDVRLISEDARLIPFVRPKNYDETTYCVLPIHLFAPIITHLERVYLNFCRRCIVTSQHPLFLYVIVSSRSGWKQRVTFCFVLYHIPDLCSFSSLSKGTIQRKDDLRLLVIKVEIIWYTIQTGNCVVKVEF